MRSVGPRERSVRVLVAEAADPPVPLSSILEAAGLRVVGRASTPEELERLLRVTRPGVVVFDAGMSVEALAATRVTEPHIGIVAVWPAGIQSEAVDQVVTPAAVRRELPVAVRRATPKAATPRRWAASPAAAAIAAPAVTGNGRSRRGGVELAVAAALTFLLVMTAVALRIGDGEGGTLARAPVDTLAPTQPGTQVTPPAGPTDGSQDAASLALAEAQSEPSPPSGGAGPDPGTSPNPGPDPNPDPDPNPSPPPITARELECRDAAGIGAHEPIGSGRQLRHAFDRCVQSDAPGPLRALAKLVGHPDHGSGQGSGSGGGGGGGGGDGDGGGHGHGHGYGHDPDHHGHGHDADHGNANGHDGDHGNGHGHAYGHDEDHGHGSDHGQGSEHGHGSEHGDSGGHDEDDDDDDDD